MRVVMFGLMLSLVAIPEGHAVETDHRCVGTVCQLRQIASDSHDSKERLCAASMDVRAAYLAASTPCDVDLALFQQMHQAGTLPASFR